jgi:DNA helicase-2/ATP-dependent DNA helicase PcrA
VAAKPVLPETTKYKTGMRVRNANWGDGVVLEARIEADGEETVDVHFASVGFKRLIASLAGLEIVQ